MFEGTLGSWHSTVSFGSRITLRMKVTRISVHRRRRKTSLGEKKQTIFAHDSFMGHFKEISITLSSMTEAT